MLAIAAAVACVSVAYADTRSGDVPNIEIIILSTALTGDSVGITYPRMVSDIEARQDLGALRRETKWIVRDIKISKGSVLTSGGNRMTSVEFVTTGAVDRSAGGFRLEPIVKALRRHGLIEVVYVVQPPFQFQGLRSFTNRYVTVYLVESGETTYRYRIRILNPEFLRLDLPIIQSATPPNAKEEPPRRGGLEIAVAVVAAVLAATMLVIATIRRVRRKEHDR